jgi:hypothetical protein
VRDFVAIVLRLATLRSEVGVPQNGETKEAGQNATGFAQEPVLLPGSNLAILFSSPFCGSPASALHALDATDAVGAHRFVRYPAASFFRIP